MSLSRCSSGHEEHLHAAGALKSCGQAPGQSARASWPWRHESPPKQARCFVHSTDSLYSIFRKFIHTFSWLWLVAWFNILENASTLTEYTPYLDLSLGVKGRAIQVSHVIAAQRIKQETTENHGQCGEYLQRILTILKGQYRSLYNRSI
jgi:hypothetical protein